MGIKNSQDNLSLPHPIFNLKPPTKHLKQIEFINRINYNYLSKFLFCQWWNLRIKK